MSPTFWRVIDRIGSTPVAALTWRTLLGDEEPGARGFLRKTRNRSLTLNDPECACRVLDVYPEADGQFAALGDERPALTLTDDELRETLPDLDAVRPALAAALAFVPSAKTAPVAPLIYHIGVVQPSRCRAMPVMLFVPAGVLTDRANFLRSL